MNLRGTCCLLFVAVFATATAANAAVHRVHEGESIQAAIDAASPGDTILVSPGEYREAGADFGLRISTDNLRLVGKVRKGQGDAGKVRLIQNGTQQTGIYAAPASCGPRVHVGDCPEDDLQGFYIRGFTVEDFPRNGIQTRFVDGFEIARNESARNLHNGIYPTISANGLVRNNVSYGSEDTAMWVAASQNVRVVRNELRDSVIGLEINVSLDIVATHNDIHDNTIGVGLFHPNSAGNRQLPVMGNWTVAHNDIYNNNTPNFAPPNSFQAGLPSGVGVLVLGVSDNNIWKNNVEGNEFVGIGLLGWCTATATNPDRNCIADPPQADPAVNDNLVYRNWVRDNGYSPPTEPPFDAVAILAADLSYADLVEGSSGNCFLQNFPKDAYTFFSSTPDGELPTDGC